MNEMLIAVDSGFVDDDGELVEITAGRTRVAPEVLARPGYSRYFDPAATARGTDSTRSALRVLAPDGTCRDWPERTMTEEVNR